MQINYNFFSKHIFNLSNLILPYFKKLNASQYDLILMGLLFNIISLNFLLRNDFILFVLFFYLSHYFNLLNVLYAKKYNIQTKYANNYNKISNWIKLYLTGLVFYYKYEKKINFKEIFITLVILILCNLNYSLKMCIKKENNIKIDHILEIYVKPICNSFSSETIKKMYNNTIYFDENLTIFYISLILTYIYLK